MGSSEDSSLVNNVDELGLVYQGLTYNSLCPKKSFVWGIRTWNVIFEGVSNSLDLLSPWSRVLLEKLTGPQLVKNFPAIYGTRRFITAVTTARHLSLSWARSIQFIPPHPTSWRSIIILSSQLRLCLQNGHKSGGHLELQ